MQTFILFDRKSGEILQVHTQPVAPDVSSVDLSKMLMSSADHERVDILESGPLDHDRVYRVDVKSRRVVVSDESKGGVGAGASVTMVGEQPHDVRTVIIPAQPETD